MTYSQGTSIKSGRSFLEVHPDLAKEWHPTKNARLSPADLSYGSTRKVWWQCSKDKRHEWQATPCSRRHGTGCSYCSGKNIGFGNSLKDVYPDLAKEWHPTQNNDLRPDNITTGSIRKVWWQCPNNSDHVWRCSIYQRIHIGTTCFACQTLAIVYPDLVTEWHPTKNLELDPYSIKAGSHKKVWWLCSQNPSHEWEAAVYMRGHGRGVPLVCRKAQNHNYGNASLFNPRVTRYS